MLLRLDTNKLEIEYMKIFRYSHTNSHEPFHTYENYVENIYFATFYLRPGKNKYI